MCVSLEFIRATKIAKKICNPLHTSLSRLLAALGRVSVLLGPGGAAGLQWGSCRPVQPSPEGLLWRGVDSRAPGGRYGRQRPPVHWHCASGLVSGSLAEGKLSTLCTTASASGQRYAQYSDCVGCWEPS